jgi:hypothetical protein
MIRMVSVFAAVVPLLLLQGWNHTCGVRMYEMPKGTGTLAPATNEHRSLSLEQAAYTAPTPSILLVPFLNPPL